MSVQKLKKSPKDDAAANGSVSATVKKALKTNSNWEDKVHTVYNESSLLLDSNLKIGVKN